MKLLAYKQGPGPAMVNVGEIDAEDLRVADAENVELKALLKKMYHAYVNDSYPGSETILRIRKIIS